ncbi:MAG TPA: electron transfer flavoprotein-ubiquinone oxidoreductase [Gammaproteobacteria bacterium]|nr:electron transfer flavoprotein-ubiquinone oxidoreductase [Gammaproteobacteria bacterium]
MEVDVVVVGAGPAGLATACRLMQLAGENEHELSVVVLEKAAAVGEHILSGAVIEPTAVNELFPDWAERAAPLNTPVTRDEIYFFTGPEKAVKIPNAFAPRTMHNHGNYIVSLGQVVRWLGEQAESLGVEIYPGFPASEVLFDDKGGVKGVATGEMGRGKNGEKKAAYEPGMELHAKYTVFAEGCRGHLGKQLIRQYALDHDRSPQHYGIGLKELWRIDPALHQPGLVIHGAGWPLSENHASGGAFLYHLEDCQVALGLIVDLNYENPYLSPFDELQRFKTHAVIAPTLAGGERLSYGARAITKGGLNSLPKMSLPGAFIVGCDAGTLNFAKIKGTHTAMKSGMLAADTIMQVLLDGDPGGKDHTHYESHMRCSWLYPELKAARNFGPALHKFGPYLGGAFNYVDQNWLRGKMPFTLQDLSWDHASLKESGNVTPIEYPKPDGVLTFDKNSSVFLSNTNHEEDQPVHLQLADNEIPLRTNLPKWAEPAQRYCPAGVYEIIGEESEQRFQINAQNCVHCKTCDIKDPSQNITWVTPEGGGGPSYSAM